MDVECYSPVYGCALIHNYARDFLGLVPSYQRFAVIGQSGIDCTKMVAVASFRGLEIVISRIPKLFVRGCFTTMCGLYRCFRYLPRKYQFVIVYIAAASCYYAYDSRIFDRLRAFMLDKVTSRFTTTMRARFMRFDFKVEGVGEMPANHTHPEAAHLRDTIAERMIRFATECGRRPYDISTSKREQRRGVAGDRFVYSMKDFLIPYSDMPTTSNDMVILSDVDYYLTEEELTSIVYGKPFIMNTFTPNALSGTIGSDGRFYYQDATTVVTVVSGGERYYHKTYKYDVPIIVLPGFLSFCVYNVDAVQIAENRQVILFTPGARVFDPTGVIRRMFNFRDFGLKPKSITKSGPFLHHVFMHKNKFTRSIIQVGDLYSVELPEKTFLAMKTVYDTAKHNNISDVEKFLLFQQMSAVEGAVSAPLIFKALSFVGSKTKLSVGLPAPSYQAVVSGVPVTDNGTSKNVQVSPCLVANGGPSPAECLTNDRACVNMRVIEPHNTRNPGENYDKWAMEFVSMVVPDIMVGKGVPYLTDQVIEKQSRPLQRARSERAQHWTSRAKPLVKSFQKKEIYSKVAAPRNISTVPPAHTLGLSKFTYPLKYGILQYIDFYMPCKTPKETVQAVRQFVHNKDVVDCTDLSSFDGTNSEWIRLTVERAVYLRYYDSQYHEEIKSYFTDEIDCGAVTKNGIRYKPDGSRLSGSPLTTDGNTINNAFASYCGYRLAGIHPRKAYFSIGPKYGDDSIEKTNCQLDKACADIGFVMKHDLVKRGNSLTFLGRVFVNPWISDRTVQDPIRTLVKIHQAFPEGVTTNDQAASNRVIGYLITDSTTPIIGDYCRKVAQFLGNPEYKFGLNKEMDMRVEGGAWPVCDELESETVNVVARSCELSNADVLTIVKMINDCESMDQLNKLCPLINNEMKVSITAVVDGKILYPKGVTITPMVPVPTMKLRPKRRNLKQH